MQWGLRPEEGQTGTDRQRGQKASVAIVIKRGGMQWESRPEARWEYDAIKTEGPSGCGGEQTLQWKQRGG